MHPTAPSLVKYDNPILVSTKDARGKVCSRIPARIRRIVSLQRAILFVCLYRNSHSHSCYFIFETDCSPNHQQQQNRKGYEGKAKVTPTEDILNSILPPREWTDDGQLWVQYVSSTPATRSDVISLQEQLDHRLLQSQARETGICPKREELYAQCFDELIRQVTINCAERGLLLLRVRDEIRMAITGYQTLYDSCTAFGMRKALQAEQRRSQMQAQIKRLEADVHDLNRQVQEMQNKCLAAEAGEVERKTQTSKEYAVQMDLLKGNVAILRAQLEELLSAPSHRVDGHVDALTI